MTGLAPPLGLRRYLRESLDRKVAIPDGAAASVHILSLNRKSESVASRLAERQLCLALLEAAGLEDPTHRG
jgi:hypothetical protein